MSEEATNENPDTAPNGAESGSALDPKAVLAEMAEMKSSILADVRAILSESRKDEPEVITKKEVSVSDVTEDGDAKEVLEKLGLDGDQYNVLEKFIMKKAESLLQSTAPKIKDDIRRESHEEALKAQVNSEMVSKYPDVAKPGSILFKKAQEKYAQLPEAIKNTAYGNKLAIQDAAEELGISPITRSRVMAEEGAGYTPADSDARKEATAKKDKEKVFDLAASFGLTKEQMQKGADHYESVRKTSFSKRS